MFVVQTPKERERNLLVLRPSDCLIGYKSRSRESTRAFVDLLISNNPKVLKFQHGTNNNKRC